MLTDPEGLWGSGDHKKMTEAGFKKAMSDLGEGKRPDEECQKVMLDILKASNVGQDSGDAFNDLRRHYNRGLIQNEKDLDDEYAAYLEKEKKAFDAALTGQECKDALEALGRLCHSWQDFFAHAKRKGTTALITPAIVYVAWTSPETPLI